MSSSNLNLTQDCGFPLPGGVTHLHGGTNFAIFARHAEKVTLVIDFNEGTTTVRQEFKLNSKENKTGDMWHILLSPHIEDFAYGYRIDGPSQYQDSGHCYDYQTILIDPYSRSLPPRKWGSPSEYGTKPCSRVIESHFDWKDDRPLKTPLSKTVIYELHVRGFTKHPSSEIKAPGTYTGLAEKIPYLKDLGITAVELMPVTEFDENDTVFHHPETKEKLKNFWGYNPVSFFAINSGYAENPEVAIDEFKEMVLAFHKAGIEVFLDLVYNHTGEGGYSGTTSSFRGIDNSIYYLLDEDNKYLNYSGCGNTMNCNHPVVRDLIRESLRYWVTEMHIDGFRFDLASILGRDQQGNVLANPPMIEVIGQDPVLRDTKLIAEAWDAAGLYQVGTFSTDPRWAEWNGRYRDDIRTFMMGWDNSITQLATRIAGSSDLYQPSGRGPLCSINFLTSHDGFTLSDLMSYDKKNNVTNGEDNRDGDNHNLSWNSGIEGTDCSPEIARLRLCRMKTMITILFLSQGVPMIRGGDEFGQSQNGNNNSWCQDNETSWLNWSLLNSNKELYRFFKRCIALRKKHTTFRRESFFLPVDHDSAHSESAEIKWQYLSPDEENWAENCHGLAFLLRGTSKDQRTDFFVMLNGNRDTPLHFTPPDPQAGQQYWHTTINTYAQSPEDFPAHEDTKACHKDQQIVVAPLSCVVLQSMA